MVAPHPGASWPRPSKAAGPLLVEVQALVSPSAYGTPSRKASGVDPNRLSLLIAVLGRRAGIALGSHDVYANLAGGLSVAEPALDLALALALASSARDRPIAPGTVAIGEVGLLGELRAVVGLERRLREAARLGFRTAVVPVSTSGPGGASDRRPRDRAGGDPPRCRRGGAGRPSDASWRGGAGDARLTVRLGRSRPGDAGHCRGNR